MTSLILIFAMLGKHGTIAALNTLNAKNGPTRVFALTVISDGAVSMMAMMTGSGLLLGSLPLSYAAVISPSEPNVLFGSNKEDASASAIKLLETKDESEVGLNDGSWFWLFEGQSCWKQWAIDKLWLNSESMSELELQVSSSSVGLLKGVGPSVGNVDVSSLGGWVSDVAVTGLLALLLLSERVSKPLSMGVVRKTLMVEELGRRKVNATYSGVLRRLALCLLLRASSHTISTQEVARGFLRRLAQRFDLLCQGRSAREHPSLDSISMIVL
ncbi:hypothetical protein Tco_1448680 [Tanacetum coccineum]